MYRITLEWTENSQIRTRTISSDDRTLFPDTIRIGRGDQSQCDISLKHPNPRIEKTVSKIHVSLVFDQQKQAFFLHNLTQARQFPKQPNPAIVDGRKIIEEIVKIQAGTTIKLGYFLLKVKVLDLPENRAKYIVKCSGPKQHTLEQKYEGLNCPYCGYIVFTGTNLKI